jgi:hypothetical protein
MPEKAESEEKEVTPRRKIIDRFHKLQKNPFFYNISVFNKDEFTTDELCILSDRYGTYNIAWGNRILLDHVFPSEILERFELRLDHESFDRYIERNEPSGEDNYQILPENLKAPSFLKEVEEAEKEPLIHREIDKVFKHCSNEEMKYVIRRLHLDEDDPTMVQVSEELGVGRTTLIGRYNKQMERLREIFIANYMEDWEKIKEFDEE